MYDALVMRGMVGALICAGFATATATADSKAKPAAQVDAAVRALFARFTRGNDAASGNAIGDAIVVVDESDEAALWGYDIKSVGKLAITIDDARHAAWFQGVVQATTDDPTGDHCTQHKCPPPMPVLFHVSGLAVDDGGWKLGVIIVSSTRSDRDLTGFRPPRPQCDTEAGDPGGDPGLTQAATAWLASGQLGASAAAGTAFATGTSPGEIARGAQAAKLAAKWDTLKLVVRKLEAKVLHGTIGYVHADVDWPYKANLSIPLRLAALAVWERGRWRWTVLDFE